MTDFVTHRDRYPDSSEAAALVLPPLFHIAGGFKSAVDVGGGIGAWAAALKRMGVSRVVCIDDPHHNRDTDFPSCGLAETNLRCFRQSILFGVRLT